MNRFKTYLILCLLPCFICASSHEFNDYSMTSSIENDPFLKEWKKVEDFERKGRPESALLEVEGIQAKAKSQSNTPQIIKSIIYKTKLLQQIKEDGEIVGLKYFEEEYEKATFPAKPILASQLAELYKGYLDQRSWQIRSRTSEESVNLNSKDIREWTISQFSAHITDLYLASIRNKRLQKSSLEPFSEIIAASEGSRLRPSIYDLLVHRAIDYFSDTRSMLTEPINAFHIDQPSYWSGSKQFSKIELPENTNSSNKLHALQIFQDAIQYHLKSKNSEALVDLEIKRFDFIKRHSTIAGSDQRYEEALLQLAEAHKNKNGYPIALVAMAKFFQAKGNLDKAISIARDVEKNHSKSFSAKEARSIINQIERKSISAEVEEVYLPKNPILVKVNYQNVTQIFYKIIQVDEEQFNLYQNSNAQEQNVLLNSFENMMEGGQELPDFKDYKSHSAEFSLPGLVKGRYILVLSDDDSFSNAENTGIGVVHFQITHLGMWNRHTTEGRNSIVVIDRSTGAPISGVEGIFSTRERRGNDWKVVATATSDEDGFILPKLDRNKSYRVVLQTENDKYYSNQNLYEYQGNQKRSTTESVTFFTDRKLYRPGQMIYFKGLANSFDEHGIPSIISGKEVEIVFRDANYQELSKSRFTTNEFGTFHGTLNAPQGGLNGSMTINANIGGSTNIQVEEYKRPTFEVLVDTIKAAYQPGDIIHVSGEAKAFAGFGIDGASVDIRVTKEQRFWCYPWWRRGWIMPAQHVQEVFQTTVETDEEGQYVFSFESDEDLKKDRYGYFQYVIHIDVTNQAGETRSSRSTLNLSSTPFTLSTSLTDKNDIDQLRSIKIEAKNFEDQPVDIEGRFKIVALISPEQTYIDRYWSKSDTILMDEITFKSQFPKLAYESEDELINWQTERIVLDEAFEAQEDIKIDPSQWGAGYYKIIIEGKDGKGRSQDLETYFEIFSSSDQFIPYNSTLWTHLEDKSYEPGDKVDFLIGTAETDLNVLFEVSKWGELIVSKWVAIKDLDRIQLDISEEDRGNLVTSIHFAKHNRSSQTSHVIQVPWTNKDLNVSLSSFRDKTKPGSEETWIATIDNPGFDYSQSELTAALYDASLDAIMGHNWRYRGYPIERGYGRRAFRFGGWGSSNWRQLLNKWYRGGGISRMAYPSFRKFGLRIGYGREIMMRGTVSSTAKMNAPVQTEMLEQETVSDTFEGDGAIPEEVPTDLSNLDVNVRENLDETVFFFPNLRSDRNGQIEFSFTMNDALTRWKFLGFAHTQNMAFGKMEALITTQKELMVIPHLPRFLRQGDQIKITSTVKNLSDVDILADVQLKIIDAITGADLNEEFHNHQPIVKSNLKEGLSSAPFWTIEVPEDFTNPVRLEVIAVSGDFSDGQVEEVPVVTNRTLVTETLPLWVNGNESKDFTFESLLDLSDSKKNHSYTIEFTSNPVWYAVQALPYLMEYPYDCTEQVWNRYYAHALGIDIINQFPKIKSVMAQWENTDALLSNLQKNESLKSALLQETPWVLDALSEAEQKRNVALLFDLVKMEQHQKADLQKIIQRQSNDGGFAWFKGGGSNVYISQYILEGLGRLNQLDVKNSAREKALNQLVANTIDFVDQKIANRYQKLLELEAKGNIKLSDDQLSSLDVHYLYARSFFPARKFTADARKAFFYFKDQARKHWVNKSINQQAMLGIALYQFDEKKYVEEMMISFKERSLKSEELGVYWKFNRGYHWSQAPIETQAKMITLYELMDESATTVDGLKKWLLKHKQTNRWSTTKSTAAAIHALLLSGNKWVVDDQPVTLQVADRVLSDEIDLSEAGSGYYKKPIEINKVNDSYAEIAVSNPNYQPAFGAAYYQYWEDMDEVSNFQDTPLKLTKSIWLKENSRSGPKLKEVTIDEPLKVGDLLTIRIVLEVDRAMEFVHMKDSRSSGLEPENVISQYHWQDGLGYYQSTKDLSTDFFFDYLSQGKYVFEYSLRASHEGQFSNGITTIQCMYAPEFTSHSNGVSLGIE